MGTHSRRQMDKYDIEENTIDKKNIHGYANGMNTFFLILDIFKI